jgi:hypothetical protein
VVYYCIAVLQSVSGNLFDNYIPNAVTGISRSAYLRTHMAAHRRGARSFNTSNSNSVVPSAAGLHTQYPFIHGHDQLKNPLLEARLGP